MRVATAALLIGVVLSSLVVAQAQSPTGAGDPAVSSPSTPPSANRSNAPGSNQPPLGSNNDPGTTMSSNDSGSGQGSGGQTPVCPAPANLDVSRFNECVDYNVDVVGMSMANACAECARR